MMIWSDCADAGGGFGLGNDGGGREKEEDGMLRLEWARNFE